MTSLTKRYLEIAVLLFLACFSTQAVNAGMCEEQRETMPWREAISSDKLPLNVPFHLTEDGQLGNGVPNAVIDRPFYNTFQGAGYVLFKDEYIEMYFETNNQGLIPQCESVPLAGIVIGDKVAKLENILTAKPYANLSSMTQDAIRLVLGSDGEVMEIINNIGRRFPVGKKTLQSLKKMYQGQLENKLVDSE